MIQILEIDNKWLYKVLAFMPILAMPILFINIGFGMFWFILAMGINAFYHEKGCEYSFGS